MSRVSLSSGSRGQARASAAPHVEGQEQGSLGMGTIKEALLFECIRVLKAGHALRNLMSASLEVVALYR